MKADPTDPLYKTFRLQEEVFVKHQIIAEWNQNRYATVSVWNYPDEFTSGYDVDLFPIESIAEPNRPNKRGTVKGILNDADISITAA